MPEFEETARITHAQPSPFSGPDGILTADSPFMERLLDASRVNDSWLVVGLDPELSKVPDGLPKTAAGILEFNRQIIEATRDVVLGYKLNFAFYEVLGAPGWDILHRTREAIGNSLFTIADAKRGDIGLSSRLYAEAILDQLAFDSITVSPYVGIEGITPFLDRPTRGAFVLCRTSNQDASLQSRPLNGGTVFEEVARVAGSWGGNVGLVVGATDLESIRRIRVIAPDAPLLIPGVGGQGGDPAAAFKSGMTRAGTNAILSASRSIIYAGRDQHFAEKARFAALKMHSVMKP